MINEYWKPVTLAPFEDVYEVSDMGRVRRSATGYTLTPVEDESGYLRLTLKRRPKQKNCAVHRLVALAFVPNPNGKPQVNHIHGNKKDNRATELEWVTGDENLRHAITTGLRKPRVLSDDDIRYIRQHHFGGGYSRTNNRLELAEMFGVTANLISGIANGSWYGNVAL